MGQDISVVFMQQVLKVNMKYIYNIKDEQGNQETINCMSYKKLLKQLNTKFKPGEVIQINYTNKKNHDLLKYVKIKRVE
mgnify:FL=1